MTSIPPSKRCSKCGVDKPLDAFSQGPRYRDGRQSYCRSCMIVYRAEKFNTPEKKRAEYDRVNGYFHNDPEFRARQKQLGAKRLKERYSTDMEYRQRKNVQSGIKNQKRRKYAADRGQYTYREWIDLCAKYDHCCLCCGSAGRLSPDHIVPLAKGGMNDISNIQPLCKACNLRKGIKTIDYRPTY